MTWSTDRGPSKIIPRKSNRSNAEGGNVGGRSVGDTAPFADPRSTSLGEMVWDLEPRFMYRNGKCYVIRHGYKLALPVSSKFNLTKPSRRGSISAPRDN